MKKLKDTWFIDINKEDNSELKTKFIKWFNANAKNPQQSGTFKYYGSYKGNLDFWCANGMEEYFITLTDWNKIMFGKEETFEKGEEVLVRSSRWTDTDWVKAIFIAEYNECYVVDWGGDISSFDQCKKKPSELDIKIEELKKFAEEKGVKLTIIAE